VILLKLNSLKDLSILK